jgi:RNA polymerase sigma-70 factor (ECF subfamily)
MPEPELARRCRGGDSRAWRELVRRFTPLVYRLCFRVLRSSGEAEDASQEVFLRMHRSIGTYDPTRTFAPWVARTAYHVCLRRLENTARRADGPNGADELSAVEDEGAPSPEQQTEAKEAGELLARAMDELPAQDRVLLELRYREGLSDSEVSEATGMPVNTVKTRIFRARGRLRSWLAPLLK